MITTHSRALVALGAAALMLTLSACAEEVPVNDAGAGTAESIVVEGVTLAETKSPAQLLRNTVADNIPQDMVESIGATVDKSRGCGYNDSVRQWLSSVTMSVQQDALIASDTLVKELGKQGWTAKKLESSSSLGEWTLKADMVSSALKITTTSEHDIEIAVAGPCVKTAGPESDEVKALEGRD
ncbi:hypothetical protein EYE40_07615 [Glaciihabitans arcticus]|uniref:DUF3558 domain-containing protein n=1 Tax=Glaciihabitans arcticus TaxID=2668039 RepID=A0A4Q9GRU0_9MICO|nr:hypothetical protein [Glaciihabitans arcticus]TBN57275.1 hypothetical protein EYE40_07615 [Glaciihabitans arcticus]